ncbi:MAG: SH3 domain-containing protein [bacterium]
MTDARQPAMGSGSQCPDFEVLSCFADGELDARQGAETTAHVAGCAKCGALAAKLRAGFEVGHAPAAGAFGGAGCVGEESLLLYASGVLQGDARQGISTHVGDCDVCVASLVRLQPRLRALADAAMPIPPAVQRRAAAALIDGLTDLAPIEVAGPRVVAGRGTPSLVERLRGWLTIPVLAPAAVAAAALFMVAIGRQPAEGPNGAERSRAVPAAHVALRVTAPEAPVYQRPSGQSAVIGTVRRGAEIEVAGEERGWYEVRLEGGSPGWVAREAFE